MNITLTIFGGAYMLAYGLSFDFFYELDALTWVLLTLSTIFAIASSIAKFAAFRNHEASKLQQLAFLPNVWQFGIDLIVLNLAFSGM